MATEQRKLGVAEREQAIFKYLREVSPVATVRELYEYLTATGTVLNGRPARDMVTVQAYHKLITRLVLDGRLMEVEDPEADAQQYKLAPALHADTALTIDDIDQMVFELRPTEAIAALIDAREMVGANRKTILRQAALALQKVPPRALVRDMILAKVDIYNALVAEWAEYGQDDERHRRLVEAARKELEKICYRWFGLSAAAVRVPPASSVSSSGTGAQPIEDLDRDELDRELAVRVFGDTVVQHVPFANPSDPGDWSNVVVAGSDGSTYSSVMSIDTAKAFVDEGGSEVVTFNNSIVYLHMEGRNKEQYPSRVYSVPITRSAIDSPTNAGMVMAPFMYRDDELSDGEYEHMVKCATDVVQWRADERVFIGDASPLGGGKRLPAPRVHLRDGTVTLQEREVNHYQRNDAYGDMVRQGVVLSRQILTYLKSRRQPPVFAGAVKGSQLHLFSTLINWFIAHGHQASGVPPVHQGWNVSRASLLADNETVTMLLATLANDSQDGYYCTFAVSRPFHALTDMWRLYEREEPDVWVERLRKRQDDHLARPMMDSFWKTVDIIEDDPYVRMCEEADYVLFYIGHTRGDPLPLAPRYEFLESLRFAGPEDAANRVRRNVELLVAAINRVKVQVDTDHNFMTGKRLVKIVPSVVYQAHEYCKSLGRRLETELKSMIVANLHRLGMARRASDDAVNFRPFNAWRYFEQQAGLQDPGTREIEDGNQGDDGGD